MCMHEKKGQLYGTQLLFLLIILIYVFLFCTAGRPGTGRPNPSRETKFSGTHGDRGMLIFPVQLTTSRIGNLTRLTHTLLYVMTIHTYIHTYCRSPR